MKYKLQSSCPLLLLLFALSGCSVHMVSDYESRTETSVSNIRTQLTRLFFELEAQVEKPEECTYQNHADQYKQVWVDLDLMTMRERAKSKNKTTSKQVSVLDEALKKLQKKHQRACLNRVEVALLNKSLTGMLDSILRFELAKLRGAPKPYTLTPKGL